ncbi:MAG: hypothetical protein NZM10_06385, partial [Fimbriimonadales bacterium]|nr:hypothetical protein [Fimbriimonadales bacterium]
WDEMCVVIQEFVEREGYLLAAAYTDQPYGDSCHYYYVRADLPAQDRARIVWAVRVPEYTYWRGGRAIELTPLLPHLLSLRREPAETRYNTADGDDRTGEPQVSRLAEGALAEARQGAASRTDDARGAPTYRMRKRTLP